MMATLLAWGFLSLCYLAFAGSLSKAEVTAAALTGAFAAFLSLGLRAKAAYRLRLRGRWAVVVAQLALQLGRETARVGATLARVVFRARGHRGQVVLDAQSAQSPVGTGVGHRAAAALIASLTPDSIALEPDEKAIPVHRLSRVSAPPEAP
ncbi:MAG TPA: hypothetical protein VFU61_07205 [Steroidobacteraceae bacterium]|jgi:multisubunit Na+/H+ antiporter MnhE subunit|nr:hypothetical protein [Steroidobacteraceae bacterium]